MKRKYKRSLIGIIILVIVLTGGAIFVRSYLLGGFRDRVLERIKALNEGDIHVHYDSVYLDWKRNIFTIENLVVERDAYDTTCVSPEFASAKRVEVRGLGFLSLLMRKEVNVTELHITNPHIVIRKNSGLLRDSAAKKVSAFKVYLEKIVIDSMKVEIMDSVCHLSYGIRSHIELNDLDLTINPKRSPDFSFGNLSLNEIEIDAPDALYSFRVKKSTIDLAGKSLSIDTIKIIPSLSKIQFGRKIGFDVDRIEGVIPFIKMNNLKLHYIDTFSVDATTAEIQMFLKIFHDKRLPHKNQRVPLPVEQLRKLRFGLNIDSLIVRKSYVEYEEFPAEAHEAGKVFFDNLRAVIHNVTNDFARNEGKTMMAAEADFMGQGALELKTIFPWKNDDQCLMEGSLKNFPFKTLNSMVEPAANMQFESGKLNRLDFNFSYDQQRSRGKLSLNYEDLKLVSFKSDEQLAKDAEKAKGKKRRKKNGDDDKRDNLKTFIINAFIIRKNLDESVPEEKRTGDIAWERDQVRSIFNYWWKSLFTGIKSAFGLDKIEARVKSLKKKNGKKK